MQHYPHQNSSDVLHIKKKKIPKFCMEEQKIQIAKAIMGKKSKAICATLTDFKLYHKLIAMKTVWCWHKNRYLDHRDRTESMNYTPTYTAN